MAARAEPLTPPAEFVHAARELGIEFEGDDLLRLGRFLALLLEANTRFNLTAVTDPQQSWMRHILDSLTLLPLIASLSAREIVDVGSGGGLPGIPLAIVMPKERFTLVEATGKKSRFLQETATALALKNVQVITERAETIGQDHKSHRGRYDMAIARAVGPLPVLLELTIPLVKVGGHVLAMKGAKAQQEIAESAGALKLLHSTIVDVRSVPTSSIIVIEKLRPTPRVYPRPPGEPKRKPLSA